MLATKVSSVTALWQRLSKARPKDDSTQPKSEERSKGLDTGPLGPALLLGSVALLVLLPLLGLLAGSFRVDSMMGWGLANWETAVRAGPVREALINTLSLSVVRMSIALVLGAATAWVLARTDLPGGRVMEMGFWTALFLPALPVLMGWIMLFDRDNGIVNVALAQLPFVSGPVFDIHSWWGMVFAGLAIGIFPAAVFLLTPAFRNIDVALEEMSAASGAEPRTTFFRVVLPLVLPAIMLAVFVGMVRSMQSFEIELVLGSPRDIDVLGTLLYRQVQGGAAPHGLASTLGIVMMALIVPLVIAQHLAGRRRYLTTIPSRATRRPLDLGKWKRLVYWTIMAMLAAMVVVPTAGLLAGSLMKIFGYFHLADPYTTDHWTTALSDPRVLSGLRNTLALGLGSAVVGVAFYGIVAYASLRTKFPGWDALDVLTWAPMAMPGIAVGLGVLFVVGTDLLAPLHGSNTVLVAAVLLANLPLGVHLIKAALTQLGAELEEASWAAGGDRMYTMQRVVLPLIAPALGVVALQVFASAVSVVALLALLGTPSNAPLALLQLSYIERGQYEAASVVGVMVLVLAVGAAVAARMVGLRAGLGRPA